MLDVICTHCGKILKIPEEYLGQKGRCNHCQGEITVTVAPPKFSAEAIQAEAEQEQKIESTVLHGLANIGEPLPLPDHPSKRATLTPKQKSCVIGCLFFVVLFGVMPAMCNLTQSKETKRRIQEERHVNRAWVQTQMWIEKCLKAPASAKFPPQPPYENLGYRRYRFTSYVDSQNSFGAMLRTDFTCTACGTGDWAGDSWQIESLTLGGEKFK